MQRAPRAFCWSKRTVRRAGCTLL